MKVTPAKLVMWSQFTAAVLFGADFLFALSRGDRGSAFAADLFIGAAAAVCLSLFARRWRRLRALRSGQLTFP